MTSYVFAIELHQEYDGSWLASVPSLPGCEAEGASRDDALDVLQETLFAFAEVLIEEGRRDDVLAACLLAVDQPLLTLEI